MTISEFKASYGIQAINLFQSKSSPRLVGSFSHNGQEHRITSTEVFDINKPVYVYPTEVADSDTGEVTTLYVLSNKSATPVATL